METSIVTHWVWPVLVAPFIGSFLGVVALRTELGGSIVAPRSACGHCGHALAGRDLVPFVSWLATRGRCRYCAAPLGLLYPAIELGALLVPLWAAAVVSGWLLWVSCLLGWSLLLLAVVDLRTMLLPDVLTMPLVAFGIGTKFVLMPAGVIDHVLGAGAGFLGLAVIAATYRRLRGREGLGLGDAKLAAAAGAWVSWTGLPSVVFLAAVIALAAVAVRAVRGRPPSPDEPLPFGPALCLAIWVVWLHGPLVPA